MREDVGPGWRQDSRRRKLTGVFWDVTELELGGPRVCAGESVAEVNERMMLFVRREGYRECDSPAANAVPLTARWAGAARRL